MNSHQRRVAMTRLHRTWPLGTAVLVDMRGINFRVDPAAIHAGLVVREHQLFGRVHKHWRGTSTICTVDFPMKIAIDDLKWLRFSHRISLRRLHAVGGFS